MIVDTVPMYEKVNNRAQWTETRDQIFHDFIAHGNDSVFISKLPDQEYEEEFESRIVAEA